MAEPSKVNELTPTAKLEKPPIVQTAFVIQPMTTVQRYLKMLIYGDFGVGKTTLAASADDVPEMRDVIFADAESGSMSVEDRDTIDRVEISSYGQLARLYEFLKIHVKARDANDVGTLRKLEARFKQCDPSDIKEPRRYRTAIVDSLTEVQKYCMYQLLGIQMDTFALDLEPESPEFREWNKSYEMISLLVRKFRNLPMHVIFVCSRQEDKDERNRFVYTPDLPGKQANTIQGFFDVVGYLAAAPTADGGDMKRRLFLTPGSNYKAKHRFKNFKGTYLDNPTMHDLYKLAQAK